VGALRDGLTEHKARQRRGRGIVFGSSEGTPFQPSSVWRRARAAWKRAGLEPIRLHEACHTFASIRHASIEATFDLYGKLMPGSEAEAAALVDSYLARADTSSRIAQLDPEES
jgi:hypothetical protein